MTAREMVALLEEALASNSGVKSITVDGQSITFDRAQALQELDYWRRQALRAAGKRPITRSINLSSAWY